jgi:hypothetical protein
VCIIFGGACLNSWQCWNIRLPHFNIVQPSYAALSMAPNTDIATRVLMAELKSPSGAKTIEQVVAITGLNKRTINQLGGATPQGGLSAWPIDIRLLASDQSDLKRPPAKLTQLLYGSNRPLFSLIKIFQLSTSGRDEPDGPPTCTQTATSLFQ